MTESSQGPWHGEAAGGAPDRIDAPRPSPPRRWLLVGMGLLVLAIAVLVTLDRRGAFPPLAARKAAAPPAPRRVFDPRYELPRPAKAIDDAASWFTADDYPAAAMRAGLEGSSHIVFTIGVDGRVAACRADRSSGAPILDTTACGLMRQRGRYWPARDASGEPIASEQTRSVKWVIPRE